MQGDSISLVKKIRIYQTDCPMSSFIVPLHVAALYAPQGKLRIINEFTKDRRWHHYFWSGFRVPTRWKGHGSYRIVRSTALRAPGLED